jgi:hypothetical protein
MLLSRRCNTNSKPKLKFPYSSAILPTSIFLTANLEYIIHVFVVFEGVRKAARVAQPGCLWERMMEGVEVA